MNKAEYRSLFQQVYKSEGSKLKMFPILKRLGISSGNFYNFLAHDDKNGDRTMSIEKLEKLYQELEKESLIPTNRSRLESLDTKSMVDELFKNFDLSKYELKQKDMVKWMNSFVGSEIKKK